MINKSLVDELFEDSELDQKIVKSFYSKESLSPDIFEEDNGSFSMKDNIRIKLLEIADKFVEFIGIDFFIDDVHLTGSLSNFNWSEYSDVDLHILVDFNDFNDSNKKDSTSMKKIIKQFFDSKKNNWNSEHDIKIKGYDVELYVQDSNEKHLSTGVYSILNNKWIIEPKKGKEFIDDRTIMEKGQEYAELIDSLVKSSESGKDVSKDVDDVKTKLKQFRQSGLEKGGEYSYENLTFKLLRRNGYIEKLMGIKKGIQNKKLSVAQ
jgi:hypothetical protein